MINTPDETLIEKLLAVSSQQCRHGLLSLEQLCQGEELELFNQLYLQMAQGCDRFTAHETIRSYFFKEGCELEKKLEAVKVYACAIINRKKDQFLYDEGSLAVPEGIGTSIFAKSFADLKKELAFLYKLSIDQGPLMLEMYLPESQENFLYRLYADVILFGADDSVCCDFIQAWQSRVTARLKQKEQLILFGFEKLFEACNTSLLRDLLKGAFGAVDLGRGKIA